MSHVKPFRAYRPNPLYAKEVASPPYDVLNSDEARIMVENNPKSFLHVGKAEVDLPRDVGIYDERVYQMARDNFNKFIQNGTLIRDEKPCFYIYRQKMGEHTQSGFVAGVSVLEYQKNIIKKHELTRPDKEDDRTRHIETTNANTGPVFLAYQQNKKLDGLLEEIPRDLKPIYDFIADDGIGHTVWIISDPHFIKEISEAFHSVEALYVADGHHRSAAASRVYEKRKNQNPHATGNEGYAHFQAVIFPAKQLKIMDYNRVVRDLNHHSPEDFLKKIEEKFHLRSSTNPAPKRGKTFGMYFQGQWHLLEAKANTYNSKDPIQSLDVSILQDNLLAPILGIGNPRTDKRIDFVGGIRGTAELEKRVDKGEMAVAFALFPTTMDELMKVADAGQVMPPKSTWFEPKLRDGLLVRSLDEI